MIVVAGGTGSLGSRIVRGLRQQGRTVRVLARPTSQADALRQAGAEIVLGDLKDPASLERACSGASVVITTASASKTGDDSIENVDVRGNQNLIAAAEQQMPIRLDDALPRFVRDDGKPTTLEEVLRHALS